MTPKRLPANITIALLILVSLFIYASFATVSSKYGSSTWEQYGGGPDQSKYFDGPQITKENVSQMQLAWVYPTVDSMPNFFSPIVVDTIMYVMAKNSSLVALNALTGKELWIHANLQGLTRRGINYWESKDKTDRRLLFTLNNTLQAIDALTGKSIMSFGTNGYVDMRKGLGRDPSSIRRMQSMMPGIVPGPKLLWNASITSPIPTSLSTKAKSTWFQRAWSQGESIFIAPSNFQESGRWPRR